MTPSYVKCLHKGVKAAIGVDEDDWGPDEDSICMRLQASRSGDWRYQATGVSPK